MNYPGKHGGVPSKQYYATAHNSFVDEKWETGRSTAQSIAIGNCT
jgi:hypothetical protein